MLILVSLVLSAAVASWVTWRIKNKVKLEVAGQLPGPPTLPGLGNAWITMGPPEQLSNVIGVLRQQYGDVFRFWLGLDLNIFVSDPEEAKNLLTSNKTSQKGPVYKYMKPFCGDGLLTGSGPIWRKSRKIVTPNYGRRAVQNYERVINQEADFSVQRLSQIPAGKTIEMFDEIVKYTTYTVCQTFMGLTREQTLNLPHLETLMAGSHEIYSLVFKRMTKWYLQIDLFYYWTKYYQRQKMYYKSILELGDTIVQHRLKVLDAMDNEKKSEILNSKDDTKDNTELSIVDRLVLSNQMLEYNGILTELFTVFTSSQEASAKITSYLLQMMAYHPDCQEKLYKEIQNVIDKEGDVTEEHLKKMTYLDMVFKEVIRLFPLAVMLQRTLIEDFKIKSVTLPAGCSIIVPIYHMHRDQRYWTNPDAFDPERFGPDKTIPGVFIPFSLGPMDCLGRYFSAKIAKTACVKILRQFRLTSPEVYEDMKVVLAVSVASVNGYPIQLHPRSS